MLHAVVWCLVVRVHAHIGSCVIAVLGHGESLVHANQWLTVCVFVYQCLMCAKGVLCTRAGGMDGQMQAAADLWHC